MSIMQAPSSLVELETRLTTEKQESKDGLYVSLETYWQKYYEYGDYCYEWNNGKLEEKGVSQYITTQLYNWFLELLLHFLRANEMAQIVNLETGFKLNLAEGRKIRKPDLGIILHDNPVPILQTDRTYHGIFDLCVEAISDSTPSERARDTIIKKEEYEQNRVKEYYVLDGTGQDMAFYRLNDDGIYEEITPMKADVIQSQVLPGFQFRIQDLHRRPTPKEMTIDPVYRHFIILDYQAEKERADFAMQRAYEEKLRADEEKLRADEERVAKEKALQRAERERQEKERLLAKLKALGISLD